MSGVAQPALSDQQADAILQAVLAGMQVVPTSPLRTEPGGPITAVLVPTAPQIDATDLVNGVLDIGALAKDVIFDEPRSVDHLKVRLRMRWILRDQNGEELKEEDGGLVAQNGLGSSSVSLVVPPAIKEMRLDTVLTPPTPDVLCLSAQVTLAMGLRTLGPVEVGPVPVVALPLLIPTAVFLFSEANLGIVVREAVDDLDFHDSSVVIVVPEHSPFVSAGPLFKTLRKIEGIVEGLSGIGGLAGLLLGLDLDAVEGQPRFRFLAADRISDLGSVQLKPHSALGSTHGYGDFDSKAFSILVLGLPGTRIHFFNDQDFSPVPRGRFTIEIGPELFVAVRTLDTDEDQAPVTLPPGRVISFDPDQQADGRWHTNITSVRFDDQWLRDAAHEPPGSPPQLACVDPKTRGRADVAVRTSVVQGRFRAIVTNAGPSGATDVRVEVTGEGVLFSGITASQGTVHDRGRSFTWDAGDLPVGTAAVVTADPEPTGGDWSARARIVSGVLDPDTTNNEDAVRIVG